MAHRFREACGEPGLAARVEAVLPEGTVMYGLISEGIAIAVHRALAQATDWTDYSWQLIHGGPQPPALHMALDEVLTAEVAAGCRPPTLRFWEWGGPTVIIGSFQSLRNEVGVGGAERHGMTVVLRIDREKLSGKGVQSAKKRVDPLRRQTGPPREAVVERLIGSFRARYGLTTGHMTVEEIEHAEKLVTTKFSSREWTARVP